MFNNLIESSSHRKELKRRGSFFLVTTATYVLMLGLTGIASIYAYDARLEEQNYEQVLTMLPPEPVAPPKVTADPVVHRNNNDRSNIPERAIAMLDTNRPDVVPPDVSAKPNKVLPLPPGPVRITGGQDWNPPFASGTGGSSGSGGSHIVPPTVVLADDPPPPPQPPKDRVVKISKILNSQAISLPKPKYPQMAIAIHLQGVVNVQVLIDETGRVVSAKAVNGHPIFIPEATRAALQAKFSPTIIGDQPVKVSGVISYNFMLQQ
ncbi:MAG TPA: energy transducer TonB [Pyrinomonadaceae bacterium]|jgi:protein TonB